MFGSRVEAEINEAQQAKTPQGQANKLAIIQHKWLGVNKFANPVEVAKKRQQKT